MKSLIASVIRGSVGGLTYTANQYHGIVLRARTSPINPGSPTQSIIRLAMSAANEVWDGLSESVRSQWSAYAQALVYTGPLGTYTVTGRNVALGIYNFAVWCIEQGVPTIASAGMTPPAKAGFLGLGPIVTQALATGGTGFQLSLGNPNDEDITVVAQISLQQSASRNRYKGPWNPAYLHSTEVEAFTSGLLVIDDLPSDGVYFVRLKAISSDSPRRLSGAAQIYRLVATTVAP